MNRQTLTKALVGVITAAAMLPTTTLAEGTMDMPAQGANMPMMGQTQGAIPPMQPPMGQMPMMGRGPGEMPMMRGMPMMSDDQGNMPMMRGMPMTDDDQGGMPMMRGQHRGCAPMMAGKQGAGMPKMHMMKRRQAMMQEHMQKMEAHLAAIEDLLRQLVEQQKK